MTDLPLASYIDHTLLRPEATSAQVGRLCAEARKYGFASVCVNSRFVRLAADVLAANAPPAAALPVDAPTATVPSTDTPLATAPPADTSAGTTTAFPVAVCSVIGFPLGAVSTQAKVAEARFAVLEGACELDMVIAIGAAKAWEWGEVADDIAAVVEAAKAVEASVLVKAIIECFLLTDEQKRTACEAAVSAGADFVKTSTGFLGGGATVEDVRLMRQAVGPNVGVKASGGIKTAADAIRMIEAGATRIGTSNSVAIIGEAPI
jgi:deoxyribose-phosphate aldolase